MASPFPQINSPPQAEAEVLVNEALETLKHVAVYGKKQSTTTGLTWGYYGGRWGGFSVADGTFALTNAADNYIVAAIATGVTTCSTSTTNWNDTSNYARVYKLTTAGSVVTAEEDHRAGASGIGGGSGGGTAGRHAVPILAGSMRPSVTGGCSSLSAVASAANQPDIVSLDFDTTTQEYTQFSIPMPKSWNEGTITFRPIWSHAATTTNFGVVWDLQALAISDNEAIGGTTNNLYIGPESSAITVAGSPAAEDVVFFRLSRVTGNGSDTMAIDARLHGIVLYMTTDAGTDA